MVEPQSIRMDATILSQSVGRTDAPAEGGGEAYLPLFELAGVGLAQIDPASFRFVRVNRRLCRITGYEEGELLARTPIDITLPADWHEDRPAFEALLAGNFSEHTVEKRYVRKDGSVAWVMVRRGTAAQDNSGMAGLGSAADTQRRSSTCTHVLASSASLSK